MVLNGKMRRLISNEEGSVIPQINVVVHYKAKTRAAPADDKDGGEWNIAIIETYELDNIEYWFDNNKDENHWLKMEAVRPFLRDLLIAKPENPLLNKQMRINLIYAIRNDILQMCKDKPFQKQMYLDPKYLNRMGIFHVKMEFDP